MTHFKQPIGQISHFIYTAILGGKVGNTHEMAQSERNPHSKNRGGNTLY